MFKRLLLLTSPLLVAGCGHAPNGPSHLQLVPVNKPVVQPCTTQRPPAVMSLYERTPDWAQMDVRQRAAATGQWALDLQTYGEKLNAATGACP